MERLTQQSANWLQTQNFIKSAFVHDMKNLLHVIDSVLHRIYEENKNKENKEDLRVLMEKLNDLSDHSSTLLEHTVNLLESRAQDKQLANSVISLHTLTKNIYKGMDEHIMEKLIDAQNAVPSDCLVFANNFMTEFVLRNLVENAVKFSKMSGVIEVYAYKHEDRVFVTVSDNGIGMDEKTLHALKNNLSVTSRQGTNNEQGNGYGLKIARHFIQQHGSELHIISDQNKGSCFYFSLPAYNFLVH